MKPRGVCALALAGSLAFACAPPRADVVIGGKNFSEQTLLGEIVSRWIEATTSLSVNRTFQLGGTLIAHRAVVAGEIDAYVEYTGTALTAVLDLQPSTDPSDVLDRVRAGYRDRWNLEVLDPLGFENTFAMLVRARTADSLGLETLSDLAPHAGAITPGFGYEFVERSDGYDGLRETYGLAFAETPRSMDLGLIYRALAEGEIDLTAGNSTEGKIESLDLRILEDDRGYFPPYEAVVIANRDALERLPELEATLRDLSGLLDTPAMRALNRQVDVEGRSAADVAAEWVRAALRERARTGSPR